ncbi:MAG: DUF4931 domain-containing protein [Defluviitaleaceae bacterium]|nr:DUF4931 domain-containing protein [Defluviitaleaceae bacterium]
MKELRTDYLTGGYVVISPARGERPMGFEYSGKAKESPGITCPFCPKNEYMTPGVVGQIGQVRTVPNLYPAFDEGSISGFGRHEVIIDTDDHTKKLHEFSVDQISDALMMMKERYLDLTLDSRIRQFQAFKNVGVTSGASIPHSHWQIVGLPFVPCLHTIMLLNFSKHKMQTGKCYLCSKYDETETSSELIIYKNSGALSYTPYASPFPYMFDILPKTHISNLGQLTKEAAESLGDALKISLSALIKLFPDLDYNVLVYSAPPHEDLSADWHLFLQIIPRSGFMAGYELSTGCYINSILPEDTAVQMQNMIKRG